MNGKLSGDASPVAMQAGTDRSTQPAEDMLARVKELKTAGKHVSALCACRYLVSAFPQHKPCWDVYIEICSAVSSAEERLFAAKGLLEWSPGDRTALRIGSEAALDARLLEDAHDLAHRLVLSMPDKPVGWLQLSRVCRASSRPLQALAFVNRALFLNPLFASALLQKSILLSEDGDHEGARAVFHKAFSTNPTLAKKSVEKEPVLAGLMESQRGRS